MSISGINSNYNNYYSNATKSQKAGGSEASSFATSKTPDEMLKYYKEKYSSLNFTSGYNTKGAGSSGLGNVILHPNRTCPKLRGTCKILE